MTRAWPLAVDRGSEQSKRNTLDTSADAASLNVYGIVLSCSRNHV